MSSGFKRSAIVAFVLFLVWGCAKNHEKPPAQIVFIASLDREDAQRRQVLAEMLEDGDSRLRAWANLLRAGELIRTTMLLQSLEYIEEAEHLFRELGSDEQGLARALHYKAHVYWSLGAISEGILDVSNEAVSLVDSSRWATYAGNNSTYLLDLGRYEEVIALSDTLLPIFQANNANLAEALAVRSTALQGLGRDIGQIDSLAIRVFEESLRQAVPLDRRHVYERLIKLNVMTQSQLLQALDFALEHDFILLETAIRDVLPLDAYPGLVEGEASMLRRSAYQRSIEYATRLNQEFLQYELERSTRTAARQREQATFRAFTYLFILLSVLIAGGVVLVFLRNRLQIKRARTSEYDAKLNLESYRNKLRPHFLFNQLNNVSGFLSQEKVVEAQEYIGLLSVHLRSLLETDKQEDALLGQEFDRVNNYIELQQLSSYPHVRVTMDCDAAVRFQRIPSGLLQPLVENSYKYAANARQGDTYIAIRGYKDGNKLVLEVEDSGFGFLERTPGTGSGLSLIRERIHFDQKKSIAPSLWGIEEDFGKQKSTVKITMPFQHD